MWREAFAVAVLDEEKLLIKRLQSRERWHFPGGKISWMKDVPLFLTQVITQEIGGIRLTDHRLIGILIHHWRIVLVYRFNCEGAPDRKPGSEAGAFVANHDIRFYKLSTLGKKILKLYDRDQAKREIAKHSKHSWGASL